jgi:hypothetical protein
MKSGHCPVNGKALLSSISGFNYSGALNLEMIPQQVKKSAMITKFEKSTA